MGIPWTMKNRNLMSDRELSEALRKLSAMRKEEYEERCEEYYTTGIWQDTMYETLIEACNWIKTGLYMQKERPWVNPRKLKRNEYFLFCLERRRKEKR